MKAEIADLERVQQTSAEQDAGYLGGGDLERVWEEPHRTEATRLGRHLPDLGEDKPGSRTPSTPRMEASRDRRQGKRSPRPRRKAPPPPIGDWGSRTTAAPFAIRGVDLFAFSLNKKPK
jgi:hypothetical protein